MYRNKKDVDKHVENLIAKLSVKEFKTRAYSIARLYYEVGDYASCQRYVEQYLTQKDNNAAAYKLLGQALQKLGQKEKALEQYKTSLDIDPTQTGTILDICELLVDDEVIIDPGRARYWCEKAEAIFPRHPVTFRLREKLVTMSNPDSEALVELLTAELAVRPKDPLLHARLLKHYLHTNQIKKAIDHSCNVEFGGRTFHNNFAWYETLAELLKHNSHNANDWLYQLLLLTVRERMCVLSLSETPSGPSKSLVESNELLFLYDQDIESIAKAGATPGFGEFHASLLNHHRGQFTFHSATFLLKKAKKDQISWRDCTQFAAPLMLLAWHSSPTDSKVNWLTNAPELQQQAVNRWYFEGVYRCSQSGHYLIANSQDKSQSFIDRISQCCSGTHWRDKLYEKLFTARGHLNKIKSSHIVSSNAFSTPTLRLPRRIEVEAYDTDAQREYANSLHHFVWLLSNYKNFAHFKCTLFDTLTPSASNYGPESLNKLDIHAFLYCAALSSKQKYNEMYVSPDKPAILPANITDSLCLIPQLKWWDCAYKFSQNELGAELTDIRATLSRGIEVVRCVDNHGLDPELLCNIGRIFSERAKLTTAVEEKNNLEKRAGLYYSSAIPLLEKLKSKIVIKLPEKRLFDYTHKELNTKDLNALIEESKLFVAINHINDCENDKAIELLTNLKSTEALYHLSQTYRKVALEENTSKDKFLTLVTKARSIAYKAMESLKQSEISKNSPLYSDTQELIDDLEIMINKIDADLSNSVTNDVDGKYSSDENVSMLGSEHVTARNNHVFRNLSSTPKAVLNRNATAYRTAVDSHILESTQIDHRFLERLETEIKNLQKRDTTMNDFIEQTKRWFDENRKLGNEIISTIHTNIQNTTDQFKLLKISVDQVKDQIDECRNECKDVGELKKQIAEMKKEINKLKKNSTEQNIDESDLYNLEDEYRTSENACNFASQLPFTPQVMPPFNQRLVPPFPVPPNPYQLYGQNLYNLYSQYSQFAQPSQVPGAPGIFDPTRGQMNYPGVYPTPEQMYLDMTQLVAPTVSGASAGSVSTTAPVIPSLPSVTSIPNVPTVTVPPSVTVVSSSKPISAVESKDIPKSLPVNVVITSSDPLPTCTTTPAPILSVTIPSKHIKGTPHNYQISMPSTNDTKIMSPPVFSFPSTGNKSNMNASGSPFNNWSQSSVFKTATSSVFSTTTAANDSSKCDDTLDFSKSVVDGIFTVPSPNVSLNKSRTLSERSNTSVENYDPCPDFKPIIPLPAEVKVTTGEEDEIVVFSSRAKLFRFVDKQWKERGIGEMKLLKHKVTGKVRVLMRREQIHKICANHIITPEMEIKPMKNETKAYFWIANDFADETVVLEKFCIRFKTAEIALQFYEKFEEARKTSSATNDSTPKTDLIETIRESVVKASTPLKSDMNTNNTPQKSGFTVGGFTFSSTPTFKPVQDDVKPEIKPAELPTSKANVFSGLTFKTTTSSPFTNIFGASNQGATSSPQTKETTSNKLNNSDTVDEFEPNVEFKPVVPLPALVEQKTGEENENVLFEHRAKLLRFDAATKEWKERGLGNIKLLVHKDSNQKVRLLMRREQIMKVCCNHSVTKEMTFQKMPNMDKAVTWCAKDFSEGELVAETFCLRFKTVQTCDDFINAVKSAQTKMSDNSKEAKEEQNAAKQSSGFGDKFKPKAGSWHCDTCYTNNLESFDKCACCEQPKPKSSSGDAETPKALTKTSVFGTPTGPTAVITSAPSGWGDVFKPKPGSWECKDCLVRNEASAQSCTACNSPKDPSSGKSGIQLVPEGAMKFTFGIPASIIQTKTETSTTTTPAVVGWGDKFKPKEGTWECKQCFVRNESNVENCTACSSPKDPNAVPKQQTSVGFPKFGIQAPNTSDPKSAALTSIFDGTGGHTFKFGIPSAQDNAANVVTFGDQKPSTNNIFEKVKKVFSIKKNNESDKSGTPKPALLPTPPQEPAPLGAMEGAKFDFVFKPKTPTKGKSPVKSPKSHNDDESEDDNEYASEDEGHHIRFSPVIPMPDKIEVVTGEENEIELYEHRAKLFRFVSGEWKERGIGNVRVLKHKETGKLRVVMRREQIFKICLNHALTSDIVYTPKDEKTWLFAANDFSEGEISFQQFCLRFKNKEVALKFKEVIDKARSGDFSNDVSTSANKENDNDDVVFVGEIVASTEEKQKAKDLMLPENFFTYKTKEPCQGCRGCDAEDTEVKSKNTAPITAPAAPVNIPSVTVSSTPTKTSTPSNFFSPANSLYGTPANFDKTADVSIFRTPLGAIGSNTKSATPASAGDTTITNDATNKENSFIARPFGGFEKTNLFGTQNKPSPVFGSSDPQTPTSTKTSIMAPPKLNALNISGGDKSDNNAKPIFGAAQNSMFGQGNPVFGGLNSGTSANKSIFSFSSGEKTENSDKAEVKSLFGGGDQKPVNLFGGGQGSLFGAGSLTNSQSKPVGSIFGASTFGSDTQSQGFGTGKSLFGNSETWTFGAAAEQKKVEAPAQESEKKKDETKSNDDEKKETPFKVDNTLSFAALSSGGTGFGIQKNTDFKWEGAGQQLFARAPKTQSGDKSKNDSDAGDDNAAGDEEYDPHYEPIVPLPDKIEVTTGEEDEEKLFGERCKLYRYDEKTREWKERGVGEMKILYHPKRNTYRMLLRREQVHKAVLNMLLYMDLELLPMKNSDRAWTWPGINYAETAAGEQETLAVKFKSLDLAMEFRDKIVECVRKLQASAAKAIREEKEEKPIPGVAPLRLPKHLADSARVDDAISQHASASASAAASASPSAAADRSVTATPPTATSGTTATTATNGDVTKPADVVEVFKQEHFQEQEQEEDEEGYDYENHEDYDGYYNEDEDESGVYYSCQGVARVRQGASDVTCDNAHVQVLFDQEIYSPKILVTDADTGEILADMLIHTDTEFKMVGDSCSWSGTDYTSNEPVDKSVTIYFHDAETAMQFYDSCETSKAATYSSTDPES